MTVTTQLLVQGATALTLASKAKKKKKAIHTKKAKKKKYQK